VLRRLLQFASAEGIRRVVADIAQGNIGMQRLCQRVGLRVVPHPDDGSLMRAEIEIRPARGHVNAGGKTVLPQGA